MKKIYKTEIKLTPDDVKGILRAHFNLPEDSKVYFNVGCTDDRFGNSYDLTGVTVEAAVHLPTIVAQERGGPIDR
jgi:hypothetical protein